jgi:hypothetical protein
VCKEKLPEIRLAQPAAPGYSPVARHSVPARSMPDLPPSAEFLDEVAASVRDTLAALEQHEASLAGPAPTTGRDQADPAALGRLEESLSGWQAILGDMAERVRAAQDDLAALDADLRRSLDAFAAARKHLQGEAASGRSA